MKGKRTGSGCEVAAESIECHQYDIGISSAKLLERVPKGIDIGGMNLVARLDLRDGRSGRVKIREIKLEHADAVIVPVLQRAHEVRKKPTFAEGHRPFFFGKG